MSTIYGERAARLVRAGANPERGARHGERISRWEERRVIKRTVLQISLLVAGVAVLARLAGCAIIGPGTAGVLSGIREVVGERSLQKGELESFLSLPQEVRHTIAEVLATKSFPAAAPEGGGGWRVDQARRRALIDLVRIVGQEGKKSGRILIDLREFAKSAEDPAIATAFKTVLDLEPNQRRLIFSNPGDFAKIHATIDQLLRESGSVGDLNATVARRRRDLERMQTEARDQIASMERDRSHLWATVARVRLRSARERDAVHRCYENHLMRAP